MTPPEKSNNSLVFGPPKWRYTNYLTKISKQLPKETLYTKKAEKQFDKIREQ